MDNFFDLIARRESCRNYDPQKRVETEKLIKCIEAARIAPSACNSQPWSFVVVNSPEVSPKVAKCVQGMGMNRFTDACPSFIVVIEEKANMTAKLGGALDMQRMKACGRKNARNWTKSCELSTKSLLFCR